MWLTLRHAKAENNASDDAPTKHYSLLKATGFLLTGSVLLLWLFCFTKYTVARWEGALLSALFIGYMAWLVVGAI